MSYGSIREAFADTMLRAGREDTDLVILTSDMSHYLLQPFAEACPGRYYNVGICEQTIVGMAAGLAKAGLVPVVHGIAPFFIERAYEQLKVDFCYQGLGGNVVAVGGGIDFCRSGPTHHSYSDWALALTLPGVEICNPGSPTEFHELFRQTYRDGKLTYFRLLAEGHDLDILPVRLGEPMLLRPGKRLTVVATGVQARYAMDIEDAAVYYVHTIRPLEVEDILESAQATGRLLVAEEHGMGGLGDVLLRALAAAGIQGVQFMSARFPDGYASGYGPLDWHRAWLLLDSESLISRAGREVSPPMCRAHPRRAQ